MSNPVVSDKMRYGLKPLAVESKQHILTLPCLGTNRYDGGTGSNIIFRIQHNPSGRYVDTQATQIKLGFEMTWPKNLAPYHNFFFERGPESIIRRLQIKDIQGRMLEDIDQYNLVYAVTEICTNNEQNRKNRDQFHMEGNSVFPDLGGWLRHHSEGPQNGANYTTGISFEITFTPFSAVFGGANEKYIPLSVMEGMEIHLQLENLSSCIKYWFEPSADWKEANSVKWERFLKTTNPAVEMYNPKLGIMSHRWRGDSSTDAKIKESGALADAALTAIGADLVWSASLAESADSQGVRDLADEGIYQVNLASDTYQKLSYQVVDPKLLICCLDVEPAVNAALIQAAKDPRDGMIRIQTFSWATYSTQIGNSTGGLFSWQIPVSVTSMKSIFFTFSDMTFRENINYLRSGFEHRGLLRYRILLGGMPLNADWVEVTTKIEDLNHHNTYSEATQMLMEAWSVHHKSEGAPSLLTINNYSPGRFSVAQWNKFQREYNAVFGHELESFSQKSGVIQSGLNTMQTTFVLQCEFAPLNVMYKQTHDAEEGNAEKITLYPGLHTYELRAYIMYDKVIAFDETSGSIRAEY